MRPAPPLSVWALLLLLILVVAATMLNGSGWDQYTGLHPDERHLVYVVSDMLQKLSAPVNADMGILKLWFSTDESPLNPRHKGQVFVYGDFPVLLSACLASLQGKTSWNDLLANGRVLSSLLMASACMPVFLTTYRLSCSLYASFCALIIFAAMPTVLQISNFFAVDAWLLAFCAWAMLPLCLLCKRANAVDAVFAGLFCGLAAACKINGILLAVPAFVALVLVWKRSGATSSLWVGTTLICTAAVTFRLANPFAFAGPGMLGVMPAESYLLSLGEIRATWKNVDFPPNWQWIAGYSSLAFLRDLALFGTGPATLLLFIASVRGLQKKPAMFVPGAFVLVVTIVTAMSFAPALRYLAPALPAAAILAGVGAAAAAPIVSMTLVALAVWWGSGMYILHSQVNSRVSGTVWLLTAFPKGTTLANETSWDDGLPLRLPRDDPRFSRAPVEEGYFELLTLQITDPDGATKTGRMIELMSAARLLVQSSGRQRDVMPRLSQRFPVTSQFYRSLAEGNLCFAKVFEQGGRYPLPFLPFDDDFAQEPWSVYDHPRVIIYERQACFSEKQARRALETRP